MSKRPWFPLYVGDLLADTMNLDPTQFGGYLKILCHYWMTEEPMTRDEMRVASGLSKNIFEKSWPLFVKKFVVENEKYFNRRMKEEITKALEISSIRSKAAIKSNQALAPAKDPASATQLQSQSQLPIKAKSNNTGQNEFDRWWAEYPKKVKRKTALSIWKRIKPDADTLINDTLTRQQHDARWVAGYVPDPTTYLNQERWNDEIQQPNRNELTPMERSLADGAEYLARLRGIDGEVLESDDKTLRLALGKG